MTNGCEVQEGNVSIGGNDLVDEGAIESPGVKTATVTPVLPVLIMVMLLMLI